MSLTHILGSYINILLLPASGVHLGFEEMFAESHMTHLRALLNDPVQSLRCTVLCVYRPVHLGCLEVPLVYEDGATCFLYLGAVCVCG